MAYKIAVVSQKGGVGKSTIARMVATEFARMEDDDGGGWEVKLADLDVSQGTSVHWMQRRAENGIRPDVRVESYARVSQAIADAEQFHVMVLDGAPHSSADTLSVAQVADVVVIPTGTALDDLEPSVRLAHELKGKGVPATKIVFGLVRTGDSEAENNEAREYLSLAGYRVAESSLPERVGYRRASDAGQAVTETPFASLNQRAKTFHASLMQQLYEMNKQENAA